MGLVMSATIATSSITSTRRELYRDLVEAVQIASHLDIELDRCSSDLEAANAAAESPGVLSEDLPGWVWVVFAGVAVGGFAGGFSLAHIGR